MDADPSKAVRRVAYSEALQAAAAQCREAMQPDIGGRLMMPTLAEWYRYLPESDHETFRRLWSVAIRAREDAGKADPAIAADVKRRIDFDILRMAAKDAGRPEAVAVDRKSLPAVHSPWA